MIDLGMTDEKEDIVADEKTQQKGLINSTSGDEYFAKVLSVAEKWDTVEQKKKTHKAPEFSVYFRIHIEDDVRNRMVLHVRRSAGLGNDFFFTKTAKNAVISNTSRRLERRRCNRAQVTAPA